MSKNLQNRLAAHTPNAAQQAINTMIERAEKHFANNENDAGFAVLAEAEEHHPNQPHITHLIGKYTADKKSPLEGIKKLEAVLEKYPNYLPSLLELGNIYLKPGDTKRATPYFHKALETAPQNPNCYISMGSLNQRKGELPLAVENYRKALELQLKNPVLKNNPPPKDDFKVEDAEKTMWKLLALMCENGVHMFPSSGTLLGIVRDGQLMSWDKDVDVGLPFSEMNRAINIMKNNGWFEINNSFGYINPRALLHKKSGLSIDLVGFSVDSETKKTLAGMWMADIPKDWNRILQFDTIKLIRKKDRFFNKDVWFPENAESFLETVYGNWKVPDKDFDSVVRAKNLVFFSYLTKCFAYARIFSNWQGGNFRRARVLAKDIHDKEPNDALIKRVIAKLSN